MALSVGDRDATSGMSKVIYEAMDAALRPDLERAGLSGADIDEKIVPGWKSFSYALASGLLPVLRREAATTPPPPDPVFAETYSSAAQDGDFWRWLSGFVTTLQNAAPNAVPAAVSAFIASSAVPTQLRGILR